MSFDDDNKIRRRKVSSSNGINRSINSNNNVDKNKREYLSREEYYNRETYKSTIKSSSSKRSIKNKKKKKYKKKVVKSLLIATLACFVVLASVGSIFVFAAVNDSTFVNNTILEQNYISSEVATSEEIPKYLKDAVVSIEDERFYKHDGVDAISLLRSFVHNLTSETTQGGSTIEMQISKNLLTTDEKTMKRKIKDIYNAIQMNKTMTKDEILVTYLNNIYLGKSAYGVKKGAKVYFGKDVSDLSLAESAMLVGITNNPAKYKEHSQAKKRQETILFKMKELGYITQEEYIKALREEVPFKSEIE
ncbi:MAG: transglycosylase domain-containing protein [Peptostreptococcaceae bacterium]